MNEVEELAALLGDPHEQIVDLIHEANKPKGGKEEMVEQNELQEAMQEAQELGDYDRLGKLALTALGQAQQAEAVGAQVQEGVSRELMGFIESRFGQQIKGMSEAEVAKLDAMPVSEALEQLERAKGPGAGTSAHPDDQRRAVAERTAQIDREEKAAWADVRESLRQQAAGEDVGTEPEYVGGEEGGDAARSD